MPGGLVLAQRHVAPIEFESKPGGKSEWNVSGELVSVLLELKLHADHILVRLMEFGLAGMDGEHALEHVEVEQEDDLEHVIHPDIMEDHAMDKVPNHHLVNFIPVPFMGHGIVGVAGVVVPIISSVVNTSTIPISAERQNLKCFWPIGKTKK